MIESALGLRIRGIPLWLGAESQAHAPFAVGVEPGNAVLGRDALVAAPVDDSPSSDTQFPRQRFDFCALFLFHGQIDLLVGTQ